MMLVDRYVEAVRSHLPRRERDDIAAELRDTLLSKIEEAERAQERPLTDDQVAAILKRYGAPESVAAKYGARAHLIGPEVYPQYRFVVRMVLMVVGGVMAIAIAATAVTADRPLAQIGRIAMTGLLVAIGNLTIFTMIFARLERMAVRPEPEDWDPRDLIPAVERRTAIPRAEAIGSLVFSVFWLLWWIDVLPINRWLLWSRLPLAAAPIWDTLTPLIVTLLVASIGHAAMALLRPRWTLFYEITERLIDVGIGVMIVLALRAPALIVATDPNAPGSNLRHLLEWLATLGLYAWGLVVLFSVAAAVWRYAAGSRRRLSDQLVM
jgi:HAAS